MPYLSNISHPHEVISRKVNYFCNYFTQTNIHLGKSPRFAFNSPSYVVSSIVYQIKNNGKKCVPYVDALVSSMTDYDFDFIEAVCDNSRKSAILKELKKASEKKEKKALAKFIYDNTAKKLRVLTAISEILKENELSFLIDKLIMFLRCNHKLEKHKNELDYLARTLVSIYRFEGFTKKQAKDNFNSIFSDNIHLFPFPSEIKEIVDKEERVKRKEEFIENRNFVQQFQGLFDSVNRRLYKLHVILKILNVELEDDAHIDFCFNGARVIDPKHSEALELKHAVTENEYFSDFFSCENYLICLFQIETITNVGDKKEEVFAKLQSVVDYINGRLSESKAVGDRHQYLTTLDFKRFSSGFSSNYPNVRVHKNSNVFLQDNASGYLVDINQELKNNLLYTENLFWEGKNQNDLVKLWQYLENTTPADGDNSREVCTTVKNILLYRKKWMTTYIYSEDMDNVLSNWSPYNRTEFPDEIVKQYRERKHNDMDIYSATKHSKNPFVKSLGLHWKADRSRLSDRAFSDYWNNILVEARGFRNMVLHDGNYNLLLKRKLDVCFPYLVMNYRYACINLVLKYKERKDYEKLIQWLVKKKGM